MPPLAGDPNSAALMSLSPSANIGGGYGGLPTGGGGFNSAAPIGIGGTTNPFLYTGAPGQTTVPMGTPGGGGTSPSGGGFPAYGMGTPGDPTSGLGGANLYNLLGGGSGSGVPGNTGQSFAGLDKAFRQAGIPGGIAALLTGFEQSGAGFNPQVAQAMIAAMGPYVAKGRADIAEQFGSAGLGMSSPAALGLAGFESQVNLDIGQIFAGMYEQSVQNYLGVLMGVGKKQPGFWNTLGMNFGASFGKDLGSAAVGALGLPGS